MVHQDLTIKLFKQYIHRHTSIHKHPYTYFLNTCNSSGILFSSVYLYFQQRLNKHPLSIRSAFLFRERKKNGQYTNWPENSTINQEGETHTD